MRSINEKCAVIGVSHEEYDEVARNVYLGLWSMQHRGQDSSGIASFDGTTLHAHKDSGLVSQVYDEDSLGALKGTVAIGHNRYSTSGGNDDFLNQPFVNSGLDFAFAHNGNLPFTTKLREYMEKNQISVNGHNDSGLMALALGNELKQGSTIKAAVKTCWDLFTGAYSCVGLYKGELFAFRDEHGIRPLSIGKTGRGYVVASETAALDTIGAEFVRDVKPGELVVIEGSTLQSTTIKRGSQKLDAFEFVYLARPDSRLSGQSVYAARRKAGALLAQAHPIEADVVIGVPESGVPPAAGFAEESGIPFIQGVIKNRYIGRTFIEPEKIRRRKVELKFNIIDEVVRDKRVVLIDDSIVRGNTTKHLIKQLQAHGAAEIHLRISSPPVKYPDFYGIDTPSGSGLLAHEYSIDEIREYLGADSLAYVGLDDFVKSTGLSANELCLSCFNGEYPIAVPYQEHESVAGEVGEVLV